MEIFSSFFRLILLFLKPVAVRDSGQTIWLYSCSIRSGSEYGTEMSELHQHANKQNIHIIHNTTETLDGSDSFS